MALKDWNAALKDAEEVAARRTSQDGGMSMRTNELDEAEQLRDSILEQRSQAEKPR